MLEFASFSNGGKSKLFCLEVLVPVRRVRRADERTRTADLISLRVIYHALQRFAQGCKGLTPKRLSLRRVAAYSSVLRSRWYQSGIKEPPEQ